MITTALLPLAVHPRNRGSSLRGRAKPVAKLESVARSLARSPVASRDSSSSFDLPLRRRTDPARAGTTRIAARCTLRAPVFTDQTKFAKFISTLNGPEVFHALYSRYVCLFVLCSVLKIDYGTCEVFEFHKPVSNLGMGTYSSPSLLLFLLASTPSTAFFCSSRVFFR